MVSVDARGVLLAVISPFIALYIGWSYHWLLGVLTLLLGLLAAVVIIVLSFKKQINDMLRTIHNPRSLVKGDMIYSQLPFWLAPIAKIIVPRIQKRIRNK